MVCERTFSKVETGGLSRTTNLCNHVLASLFQRVHTLLQVSEHLAVVVLSVQKQRIDLPKGNSPSLLEGSAETTIEVPNATRHL